MRKTVPALAVALALAACSSPPGPATGPASSPAPQSPATTSAETSSSATPTPPAPYGEPTIQDVTYPSRDVRVPANVTLPTSLDGTDGPFPVVLMAHGHGGSRSENGGFDQVAAALAAVGIASIRMDFPGCGDSTESFANNNLTTMRADLMAALDYVTATYPVDPAKVGIFGYSMGGHLTLDLLAEHPDRFAAAAMLAPAADTQALMTFFGGQPTWDEMKAQALANGTVEFTTIFGQVQTLGSQFFTDLEADPNPTSAAAAAFDGPTLVIYAEDDHAVPPAIPQAVADALGSQVVLANGQDHGYGFYTEGPSEALTAILTSVPEFFAQHLG